MTAAKTGASPGLSDRQQRFVELYCLYLEAARAAAESGYSKRNAKRIGYQLLQKPQVQAAIAARQKVLAAKFEVTEERVIGELARLAFVNPRSFLRITPDGEPAIDLSKLTDDEAAALTEFTVEDFTEGRGENKRDVRRVRLKWADKGANLERLGRHLGLFTDRLRIDAVEAMSDEELDAAINAKLAALGRAAAVAH